MSRNFFLRWEIVGLAVGSVIIVLTRWIYKSQYLFHWDSVQFALAFDSFDVLQHQPHPPGYIIYIWLGRLYNYFFNNDNLALIAISITFSLVGLWGIFYLVKYVFKDVTAAYLAAIFYLVSMTVWFHGLVAEVYIVESGIIIWTIFMLYRAWKEPTTFNLILSVGLLGILGGFRQVAEIALLPVFIYVLVTARFKIKQLIYAITVWIATNLIWFIPLTLGVGGVSNYLKITYQLSQIVFINDFLNLGVWPKLVANLSNQIQTFRLTIMAEIVILFLIVSPYLIRGTGKNYQIRWREVWFWLLTIGFLLLLPAVTLSTNPGYVLTPTILLVTLAAVGLVNLWRKLARVKFFTKTVIFGLVAVGLVGYQIFNFFSIAPGQIQYISPALSSVDGHDEILSGIIENIQSYNADNNVAVWVETTHLVVYFGIRHLQYYLPEINIYRSIPESFVVKNIQDRVWQAQGAISQFEPTAVIDAKITKIFSIRNVWNYPSNEYAYPVELSNGKYIIYYDVSNPETREYLKSKFPFDFVVDR